MTEFEKAVNMLAAAWILGHEEGDWGGARNALASARAHSACHCNEEESYVFDKLHRAVVVAIVHFQPLGIPGRTFTLEDFYSRSAT